MAGILGSLPSFLISFVANLQSSEFEIINSGDYDIYIIHSVDSTPPERLSSSQVLNELHCAF